MAFLIVWFELQRKKWSTWRWPMEGPKHVVERSYVRIHLNNKNTKQVVSDCILPIYFVILYNTTGCCTWEQVWP